MSDSELLQIQGVGRVTAARLGEAGIGTVAAVAGATLERLVEVTRFPPARATAIRRAAMLLAALEPEPAAEAGTAAEAGASLKSKDRSKKKKRGKKGKKKGKGKGKGKKKSKGKKKGKDKGKKKSKGKGKKKG